MAPPRTFSLLTVWPKTLRSEASEAAPAAASVFRNSRLSVMTVSEIELRADLCEARDQNGLGTAPGRIDVAFGLHRVGVERVVDIQIHRSPPASPVQQLGETKVELVEPVAVHRPRIDDVDRDVLRAAGEIASERLPHGGVRHDQIGRQRRAWNALERSAQSDRDLRNRVGAEHLELC